MKPPAPGPMHTALQAVRRGGSGAHEGGSDSTAPSTGEPQAGSDSVTPGGAGAAPFGSPGVLGEVVTSKIISTPSPSQES